MKDEARSGKEKKGRKRRGGEAHSGNGGGAPMGSEGSKGNEPGSGFLRIVLENLNDVVFALDINGVFTYISPAIEALSHYSVEEVVGRPFVDFIHPDDLQGLFSSLGRTLDGRLETYEFRVIDKNGETRYVRTSSRPIMEDGEARGLAGVMTDVTATRSAEDEARMLKAVCENANFGIAVADLEGKLIFINGYFALSHGYRPEEIRGANLSVFHNREQMREVEEINRRLREEGRYDALEVWHVRRDGTAFPMLMNGVLIKDKDGEPRYIAATGIDITRRKEWEKALLESEERYRDLFENAGDLIQSVDPEGRFLYVNRAWLETLGYERDEVRELNLFDIVHPRYRAYCNELFERVLQGEEVEVTEVVFQAKDGGEVILEGKNNCRFEQGRPVSTRSIFRDITARRRAEEELKRYREQLEELVEARTLEIMSANERLREEIAERAKMQEELRRKNEELEAFAHTVSHDLRGSLAVICGFSETALQAARAGEVSEVEECLECVKEAAGRMDAFMYSLLTYAQMGWAGDYDATAEAGAVLREVLFERDSEIKAAGVEVRVRDPLPVVRADAVRLYQVLNNLVGNALKYRCREAVPQLTVDCRERGGMAVFCVRDNGIGIPPQEHENIFRPFARCCGPEYLGLGIGLATVKRAVEGWGGEVWVESSPGEGSSFYFSVPLA